MKYIGRLFEEEVELLRGTLMNYYVDFRMRGSDTPHLIFDSPAEAERAYRQMRHFLFSCKLVDLKRDGLSVIFIRRPHSPIAPSRWFRIKRRIFLHLLFRQQFKDFHTLICSMSFRTRWRGRTVSFPTPEACAESLAFLDMCESPRDDFGLMLYERIDDRTIRIRMREDIPF